MKTTETNKYSFKTEGKPFIKARDLVPGAPYTVTGIYKSKGLYGEHWVAVLEDTQLSLTAALNDTAEQLNRDGDWVLSVNEGRATVVVKERESQKYGKYFYPVFNYYTEEELRYEKNRTEYPRDIKGC